MVNFATEPYMALYWVFDRRISRYLSITFTLICLPLAVMAVITGVGLILLFPSIWLSVYLVRYHFKKPNDFHSA